MQQAVVLRVARPELLDQLAESPQTRKYIRETVSSTVALVVPRDWPEMVAALLEMGILPEVEAEPVRQLSATNPTNDTKGWPS
jgi:hypothetical protein